MNETWGGDNWFANWVLPDPKANWGQVQAGMADLAHGPGAIDKTIGGLKVLSGSIFLVTDFVPGENAAKNALKKGSEEVAERAAKAFVAKEGKEALTHLGEKTAKQTAEAGQAEVAGKFRGGVHSETKGPVGDGLESHHMPAKSVSGIDAETGPAIQMEPGDHRLTSSHGSRPGSADYRAEIGQMVKEGNMRNAMATEIRDVKRAANYGSGDSVKYNGAMREMLDRAKKDRHVPPNPKRTSE